MKVSLNRRAWFGRTPVLAGTPVAGATAWHAARQKGQKGLNLGVEEACE